MRSQENMRNIIPKLGLIAMILLVILLTGCGVLEVGVEYTPEPGFSAPISTTRTPLDPVDSGPGAEESPTPTGVSDTPTTSVVEDPPTEETVIPTPSSTPTPFMEPADPVTPAPTPANWTPTPQTPPGPSPTPTPVAPLPGLVYRNKDGLWWVTAGAVLVSERSDAMLSPDGRHVLYMEGDDIWLQEIATGLELNLTAGSGRTNCCAQWWPERLDTIIFGSWPAGEEVGPTTGNLSAVNIDGTDYRVLDEVSRSNALPGPGPDGLTIANDRAGTSWLYRWDEGAEPLNPADFGLVDVVRIGGPAWSPDGQQVAWIVAVTDPEWRIAVAVFDLVNRTGYLLHPYQNAGRGGWFPPPAWSPDGRWLAFAAEDIDRERRGVWVVAVDGSEEKFLGPGWNPVWSPDGSFLTFAGTSETGLSADTIPWVVVPESWYAIPFALPAGSVVVDWVVVW